MSKSTNIYLSSGRVLRKCARCRKEKDVREFQEKRRRGVDKLYYSSYCKPCERDKRREYYRANKDKASRQGEKWRNNNPVKYMFISAKSRAKRAGIDFNIEEKDIVIPEYCPMLEVKLDVNSYKEFCPSLDRIDPSKGYIKGNVWVISNKANRIKTNATKKELERFARNIYKLF